MVQNKFNPTTYSSLPSSNNGRTLFHHCFNNTWIIPSLISFLLGIVCAYTILFPSMDQVLRSYYFVRSENRISSGDVCDVFHGRWVEDESYPLYDSRECPFAERGFSCLNRKDRDYTKWRWQPEGCEIPRFNVSEILEKLRGKRVVIVGDSLSRTQWESLNCMLMTGVENKSSVYEINGHGITKTIRFLGVRFSSHNISIDFYRSVFLMKTDSVPVGAPKNVKMTLRLDEIDDISDQWIDSDILVFNSGNWWTEKRLFREMGCFFRIGNSMELGVSVDEGYEMGINTWAAWADANINPNRTSVFFRTIESTHWSGNDECNVTRRPTEDTKGKVKNKKSGIIMEVLRKMKVPVKVMHLTPLGVSRTDAHVGRWGDNPSEPDCGHWCLPGFPDVWNQIIFSYFLPKIPSFSPNYNFSSTL